MGTAQVTPTRRPLAPLDVMCAERFATSAPSRLSNDIAQLIIKMTCPPWRIHVTTSLSTHWILSNGAGADLQWAKGHYPAGAAHAYHCSVPLDENTLASVGGFWWGNTWHDMWSEIGPTLECMCFSARPIEEAAAPAMPLLASLPRGRSHSLAMHHRDRVFCSGGSLFVGSQQSLISSECLSLSTANETAATCASMNDPRYQHAGAVNNDKLWVTGGISVGVVSSNIATYDPVADQWCNVFFPLRPRWHHAVLSNNGALWIVGGETIEHTSLPLEHFDPRDSHPLLLLTPHDPLLRGKLSVVVPQQDVIASICPNYRTVKLFDLRAMRVYPAQCAPIPSLERGAAICLSQVRV